MTSSETQFHTGIKNVLRKWAFEPANAENLQLIFKQINEVADNANKSVPKEEKIDFRVIDVRFKDNDLIVDTYIKFFDGGKSFRYVLTGKIEGEIYSDEAEDCETKDEGPF